MTESLAQAARSIFICSDATAKARRVGALYDDWRLGRIEEPGHDESDSDALPERPGRPERPLLRPAREVARRRISQALEGRIALLHALAHIELNAIDLALDILLRFPAEKMPKAFYDNWLQVAAEEGKHFLMLDGRLHDLSAGYGDLAAHDGLWQAAQETSRDLLARLAVVPLVLEARGLDVTPVMIEKLQSVGDDKSADLLRVIYHDEIGHVAIGKRWFDYLAEKRGCEPRLAWQEAVRKHFRGQLKPPFNDEARGKAGFPSDFYQPLV